MTFTALPFAATAMFNLSITKKSCDLVTFCSTRGGENISAPVTVNQSACKRCKIWKFCKGQTIRKQKNKKPDKCSARILFANF